MVCIYFLCSILNAANKDDDESSESELFTARTRTKKEKVGLEAARLTDVYNHIKEAPHK